MGIIRVLLAIAVLVAHTSPLFGLHFFGGGVIAVECFFVISGFYMALVLSSKYPRIADFYFNRAIRIYPLYLAVLVAFAVIAGAYGAATGRWLGVFAAVDGATPVQAGFAFLANVAIFGSDVLHFVPFGTDSTLSELLAIPVVWSLAVELTFYVLAPFLNRCSTRALSLIGVGSLALRLVLTWGSGGWTPWIYYFVPSQLFFFVAGMLAYRYYSARVKNRPLASKTVAVLTAVWCLTICAYANLGLVYDDHWFMEGAFVVLLPYVFELTKSSRIDRAFAEWSYPIYLVHCLVLTVYAPLRHFVPPTYYSLVVLGLSLAGSAIAVRFDRWIEHRLKRVPGQQSPGRESISASVSLAPALAKTP
ncbi:MAG TPA: acyltransferase [Caulifigura sp.]|nr:acyltransferase [Caulifigura sp.]